MIERRLIKLFENIYRESLCVFLYHEVSDSPSDFNKLNQLNVSLSVFEKQIKIIGDLFNIITPKQLITGNYRKPAALITFDDGMPGYFENAVPIMERLTCPSIIFMNMAPVEGEIFWSGLVDYLTTREQDFLNWLEKKYRLPSPYFLFCTREIIGDYLGKAGKENIYEKAREFYGKFSTGEQLAKCADNKFVYLGNHLFNHYNAVTLSEQELKKAFMDNRQKLEKYSNYLPLFSYPYGKPETCFNLRTNGLILELGAQAIFTAYTSMNFKKGDPIIHRFGMGQDVDTEKEFKCSLIKRILKQRLKDLDFQMIFKVLKYL